jgi:hypothetical protein
MTSANSTLVLKAWAIWREARKSYALRNWRVYATAAFLRFKVLAPYALIELILPGGSVMALLLWLYRRRKKGVGSGQSPVKLLSFLGLTDPLRQCGRSECGQFDERIQPLKFGSDALARTISTCPRIGSRRSVTAGSLARLDCIQGG